MTTASATESKRASISGPSDSAYTLSIVIPCYNESETLEECVRRVLLIASDSLRLELVIVDDASSDDSLAKAHRLAEQHAEVKVFRHDTNQGKGAALRTGFRHVSGDFVAVQDADLEYDPRDLVRLLEPLQAGKADVVLGSRFLSDGAHRVLYFWHSLGNRFLTLLSNIFTDLNLTDMETCYKVFRREIIQSIDIEENRFGFEPEIVAKIADLRVRVYEMGISYDGRTYEEGKKIGVSDGFHALYCILRYNSGRAPIGIQFLVYLVIGAFAALLNLASFSALFYGIDASLFGSVALAFATAAIANYFICVSILFHRNARWENSTEWLIYGGVILMMGSIDYAITQSLVHRAFSPFSAKLIAILLVPVLNFAARRFLIFPTPTRGAWGPSNG